MKKLLTSVASAVVFAGLAASGALAAPAGNASESTLNGNGGSGTPSTVTPGGAVVVKGAICLVPVPGEPPSTTTDSHSVVAPSGNVTLTCHARGPRRGATFSGFLDEICQTPSGVTSGHLVATRSGRVNLSCHVHPHAVAGAHSQAALHRWLHGAVAGHGPLGNGRKS
jgi:hypothetical protein